LPIDGRFQPDSGASEIKPPESPTFRNAMSSVKINLPGISDCLIL
jgi:hypothetical protein